MQLNKSDLEKYIFIYKKIHTCILICVDTHSLLGTNTIYLSLKFIFIACHVHPRSIVTEVDFASASLDSKWSLCQWKSEVIFHIDLLALSHILCLNA